MITLQLLITEHCSLCEQVLEMLFNMPEMTGHELLVIDIAEDSALFERYAQDIPVLTAGDEALCAPFSPHELRLWLDKIC